MKSSVLSNEITKNIVEVLMTDNCFSADGPLGENTLRKLIELDKSIYPRSVCASAGIIYFLRKEERSKKLFIFSAGISEPGTGFEGETNVINTIGRDVSIRICGLNHVNCVRLREVLPFTKPVTLGLNTSFGMGDRLGITTPGHILAARDYDFSPIFPQQSIREMTRTGRSPDQVMDDACWAVFQEGFRRPFGADADHLKTEEDVRYTFAAGFTFYTIDPFEHLNLSADSMDENRLESSFDSLFQANNEKDALLQRYTSGPIMLADPESGFSHSFKIDTNTLMRIAVKYLSAVRHTSKLHALLCDLFGGSDKFDFEMSVDETSSPTTPEEHLFVALEMKTNGISLQSLAPRYVGEFQKGIDFIGDVEELEKSLRLHALIAKCLGPYKLSIHSGSDKFSIFPLFGEITGGLLHEKTAGTSYLEAIRVIAIKSPSLYREIHKYALSRFETDRASYHVTTDLTKIPDVDSLPDKQIPSLLDDINTRQLIHITYGSVLTVRATDGGYIFHDRIMEILNANEELFYKTVAAHFVHHIETLGIKKVID